MSECFFRLFWTINKNTKFSEKETQALPRFAKLEGYPRTLLCTVLPYKTYPECRGPPPLAPHTCWVLRIPLFFSSYPLYPKQSPSHYEIGCLFWWADHSTVTVSPPSFSSAHLVPHVSLSIFYAFHNLFLWFQWLSCCSYFISFHSLSRSLGLLCSRASRFLRGSFVLLLPPVFTHYKHSTGIQIPVPDIYFSLISRSKDLNFACTYYYITPSQPQDAQLAWPFTHLTLPHPIPPSHFHLQQAQYWDLNTRSKY